MTGRPRKAVARTKVKAKKHKGGAKPAGAKSSGAKFSGAKSLGAKAGKNAPLDGFIAAGVRSLGLVADPAWMPAIRAHLEVTLRHGAAVTGFALPDDTEPAPVFKA